MTAHGARGAPGSPGSVVTDVEAERMTPYLWRLLAMLVSATFFDGFDVAILGAVAPQVERQYGLSHGEWGLVNTAIRLGAVVSFFVLVFADRHGRRRMITLTVLGYALATGLTALSRTIEEFTALQFLARVFLAGEFALALIIVGEEYPTRWRSVGIALLTSMGALGTIAAFLAGGWILTHYPWRTMYLLGLVPIFLVFFFRLGMRETRRFERVRDERGRHGWGETLKSIRVPFQPRYRRRALLVTLIWNCNHLVTTPAVTFWTIHASRNHGYSPADYALVVASGYLVGFLFGGPSAGWLMNRLGRKWTCAGFYLCASVAIFLLFWVPSADLRVQIALMSATIVCFIGANAATSTYATELFPTAIRATGYSWTTNLFGRVTEITTPVLVGVLADRIGIPWAVGIMAIGPVLGALVVIARAPETKGKTLEQIDADLLA
jgi:MFS transporter, putative metabolite:H+ symporter